ncbi:MAG TPA: hypothetical protein VKU38_15675, partial [Ktedonobacteraceae bacterium]|nr:hypothetical protein [Ktedonobacteraceae bacterium]
MFVIGVIPALLVLFIRFGVPESEVWQQHNTERVRSQQSIWTNMWIGYAFTGKMLKRTLRCAC